MTNTGDFRRYSYSTEAAYAVQAFNYQRTSAAPSYVPTPKKDFKVRERSQRKSKAQLLHEQKLSLKKALQISVVAAFCLTMLFAVLYTNAKTNELTHEISDLQKNLSVSQSENTRLNSELDSLVSMNMIDQYAVEKLGMTKMKSNQIKYIDVSQYKQKRMAAAQAILNQKQAQSKAEKKTAAK